MVKDVGSVLDDIKRKLKSISNRQNLSSPARNKSLSIYSAFDKTIKRQEAEFRSRKLLYKESMKIENLNDKWEVAPETRLTEESTSQMDQLTANISFDYNERAKKRIKTHKDSKYYDNISKGVDGIKTPPPRPLNDNGAPFFTPNKRQMNNEKIIQYLDAMRQLLKYDRDVGDDFKSEIMQKIEGEDNRFHLYYEKISIDFYNMVDIFPNLSRKIGERKYIVQNISSLFRFYERTFGNMCFDWIEPHSPGSKLLKSPTNSGIAMVDVRGIRLFDDKEIFQVEVSGPPSPVSYELYSTLLPFSLDAISKYKVIGYISRFVFKILLAADKFHQIFLFPRINALDKYCIVRTSN
ncbi:7503_t:CDS:2 [Paraglomus brasilianum]|uniref:7503_t:CDS:1 n=1 Tax=Paraglomus brasilianum TaxID=144538 RepID=A0A9N8VNL4_9GLOM|nr:7503_t:CDS:2 [Paraglomus brasilianum]